MRTLLLLAIVSLPTSAAELQFDITGTATPFANPGVFTPYHVTFELNTLSGQTTSSFSDGCLTAWSFSGVHATNLSATVGVQSVLNVPATLARGGGGSLEAGCFMHSATISVGEFILDDVISQRTTPLNPKDPLADLLINLCHLSSRPMEGCFWGGEGSLPGWDLDSGNSVKITALPVPEPGVLALFGLSLTALVLARAQTADLTSTQHTRERRLGRRFRFTPLLVLVSVAQEQDPRDQSARASAGRAQALCSRISWLRGHPNRSGGPRPDPGRGWHRHRESNRCRTAGSFPA